MDEFAKMLAELVEEYRDNETLIEEYAEDEIDTFNTVNYRRYKEAYNDYNDYE